jgi:hypothetical protein
MAIIALLKSGFLTSDGDYGVSGLPGSSVLVEAAGTYGGATVALGYMNLAGTFQAYKQDSSAITIGNGEFYQVTIPGRGVIVLRVASAGATTDIKFLVTPVHAPDV